MSCRCSEIIDDPDSFGIRYHLDGFLGQGGVACIFLATDNFTGKKVILKMAHQGKLEAAAAIKSEYSFGMIHRHPALINPTALFNKDGRPVIVMPFVEGIPYDRLGPFLNSSEDNCRFENLIIAILECAAFIHFSGHLYNDFKPSNFIWRREHDNAAINPMLLDFNLVSVIGEANPKRGTIEYVAPEVLLGETPSPASDLYSIGVTLYELLAGYPPFRSDDSSSLIKEITESGVLDLNPVASAFRAGVESLLNRDPSKRPQNAAAAASEFGLRKGFDDLVGSNSGIYLAAGRPPFAAEIMKVLTEYLARRSEKAFSVICPGRGAVELDFVTSELTLSGYSIERLWRDYSVEAANRILDFVADELSKADQKIILTIDDLLSLDSSQRAKIRALLRAPRFLPVITSVQRWRDVDFPCQIYDPLLDHSPRKATAEVLSVYLKSDIPDSSIQALSLAAGGDPEIISLRLLSSVKSGKLDLLAKDTSAELSIDDLSEIDLVMQRMVAPLDRSRVALLALLAAWGGDIPMILLAEFNEDQKALLDSLLAGRYLRRNKDSIGFTSNDGREYICDQVPPEENKRHHRFWGLAAEKFLTDSDELLEAAAVHWGKSDDPIRGFEANLAAANEFYKRSDLIKANIYAERLLELAESGSGSLTTALMLSSDILKQAGAYQEARSRYLVLLRCLNKGDDVSLKAETYKDLGDLYRSTKMPAKALYYTGKALALFKGLGYDQGMADCHNNIGLILWVNQEYEKALQSFSAAFEANEKLGNYREQAKIQSNIGIIKEIMGRTDEVARHFEKAYEDAQKAADSWLEALIANNLGYYFIRHNFIEEAQRYLHKALEISEKIGYTESTINALSNLGLCDLRSGALFSSIDYCQRAMQMAEAIGNKHLAFDARLFLSEIGVLMGNFSLADDVLRSLEMDQIYRDNKAFARQVDILRSRWHLAVGNPEKALCLADNALEFADEVGDKLLKLEAELALLLAFPPEKKLPGRLGQLADEASSLGHNDLAGAAALALADRLQAQDHYEESEMWLKRVAARSTLGRHLLLKEQILQGKLNSFRTQYDPAIDILVGAEGQAAGSGFIPTALEAAVTLAEIYKLCGKISRAADFLQRAEGYARKIVSSLPQTTERYFKSRTPLRKLERLRVLMHEGVSV